LNKRAIFYQVWVELWGSRQDGTTVRECVSKRRGTPWRHRQCRLSRPARPVVRRSHQRRAGVACLTPCRAGA